VDVFKLRQHVIDEYAEYTKSFLTILDPAIHHYVHHELDRGKLWPDALIQLSPAYDQASTVADLVQHQVLHPRCADIFQAPDRDGTLRSLRLYYHQRQAIDLAQAHKHFVVTTGTGSGKSLTYIIPIIDHVLRNDPAVGKVRAIIVYPMNALINSQAKAIKRFLENLPEGQRSVTYARYTGQEGEARKKEIQQNPPHILLTNYVMLELMLTRPEEFAFVDSSTAALQFVVLDELHTYRGRQGADVALLMRRLRDRSGNPNLLCIGTSATMASGDSSDDRRTAVAAVAGKIFGVDLSPTQVIEETLTYAVPQFNQPTDAQLRTALLSPIPETLDWTSFQQHPLAAWIEATFSLRKDATGALRRAEPRTLQAGAEALAERTGVAVDTCRMQLRHFFQVGSIVRDPEDKPGFAFKLHQFISQGSAVYSTLHDVPERRVLTLEGQRYIAGADGDQLLFPLVFCRECGQHYALAAYHRSGHFVEPRQPISRGEDVGEDARSGYLLIGNDAWGEGDEELLPDSWFSITRRGRTITKTFKEFVPQRLYVRPDGTVLNTGDSSTTPCWFLPSPFLTCLRCGVVYTRRDRDDFRKLARLSSEGRSTATTLVSVSAIDEMRRSTLALAAQKLLSFTDNRQDASLQAGHFNDFASVALLRSAIARALEEQPETDPLTHLNVAPKVCRALDLPQEVYAKDVGTYAGARRRNEEALTALLEYRIYEDLRRSWRVTQPNLEQCGLLHIDYLDLHELCQDDAPWRKHTVLEQCTAEQRETTIRALLEYMRRELAVDAPCLDPDRQSELVRKVNAALIDPWALAEEETRDLRKATSFVVPNDEPLPAFGRSLSVRGTLGRFLRSPQAWPCLSDKLDDDAYEQLLSVLLDILVGANILTDVAERGPRAVQIRRDTLLWQGGNNTVPGLDPIRSRRMAGLAHVQREANVFFRRFYAQPVASLRTIEGREHTGQVPQEQRELREDLFRDGKLPVLFCSPTMELGIDIADLNVVHMRNVPPTPANYAQRSGRAARSGQPALVITYCSTGSGHDQYFFQRPLQMVAGAVAPPQIDLGNEDLVRAHMHAIWLGFTGLDLTRTILNLVNTAALTFPLRDEIQLQLQLAPARAAACLAAARRILAACQPDLQTTTWFDDDWLTKTLDGAAMAFEQAFERWRELYQSADAQLHEARQTIDISHQKQLSRDEVEEARRRQDEALRQKDLLCNNTTRSQGDSDFYPYRYLASEGFLPGYNFPRLPVRAFLPTERGEGTFLARPRFLAITEFGPQNIVYHEGRKYRIVRTMLPAGDAQARLLRAKICRACGYFHEGTSIDVCEQCHAVLDTHAAQTLQNLFEMTTVTAQRVDRITCEEEDRVREGFTLKTHYQFSRDQAGLRRVDAETSGDGLPIQLSYGPAATIWRINHGWRRAKQEGFSLDLRRGVWGRQPDAEAAGEPEPGSANSVRQGIRLVVRDTRNLLIVLPPPEVSANAEVIASLQYALQRGIEAVFQLEEQELNSERLGEGARCRIIYGEPSEGGAGVLRRLVEEPDALARVAREALAICHFDSDTGAEVPEKAGECARACYRCLLSYSNQPDHSVLNRRAVRDLLVELAQAAVHHTGGSGSSDTAWPDQDVPPAVRQVLTHIATQGGRAPDAVLPEKAGRRPHLFYAPSTCVLCPAPEEQLDALRSDLEDAGYVVVTVHADHDLEAQLAQYRFWKRT